MMFNKDKKIENKSNNMTNNGYTITIGNKRYAFDLEEIKRICLVSATQKEGEREITEVYGGEESESMELTSKIVREIKTQGNGQTDMIIYDLVKLFVVRLLENGETINEDGSFNMDFSTSLALNTMIKWKLLIEVE